MRERRVAKEQARLVSVLVKDRMGATPDVVSMLRSDARHLLADYFDLDEGSLKVTLDAKEDGAYVVHIAAKAVRIRS